MSTATDRPTLSSTRPRAPRRALAIVAIGAALAGIAVASLVSVGASGSGSATIAGGPDAVRLSEWQEAIARTRQERAQRLLDRLFPGQAIVEVTVELEPTVSREAERLAAEWPAVRSRVRATERDGTADGRRHETRTDEYEPFVGTRETTALAPAIRTVDAVLVLDPSLGADPTRRREITEAVRSAIGTADDGTARIEVLVESLSSRDTGNATMSPVLAGLLFGLGGVALAFLVLRRRAPGAAAEPRARTPSNSVTEAEPAVPERPSPAAVPTTPVPETGPSPDPGPFERFARFDPRDLAGILHESHPQLAAVLLAHLPAERAAAVLAALPRERQADAVARLASLEHMMPDAIERAAAILDQEVERRGLRPGLPSPASGAQSAAEILNLLGDHELLREIEAADPDAAGRVRDRLFTFADLERLDGRALQRVLSRVDAGLLALALKAAPPGLEQKVFANLSRRAGDLVREEREALGPTPRREVEEARAVVVNVVRELIEREEIVFDDRGAELV